jgi:hypothetical protein
MLHAHECFQPCVGGGRTLHAGDEVQKRAAFRPLGSRTLPERRHGTHGEPGPLQTVQTARKLYLSGT